ncbi:MAG: NAD(P)/FAD-dependent oxidoreductase [Candidatus Eiseniibacteriota bacterium]
MKPSVLVLGAGFGGLELCTTLSEALGENLAITLIDQSDSFMLGFSKLDVLFGRASADSLRLPYAEFVKPGVSFKREIIRAIDPAERRVTTDQGTHSADVLVVALGADYDAAATRGLELGVNEFYTIEGAIHLGGVLPTFKKGHAVVGLCGAPYKCPPAPSECVLMLHDYLSERGVRGDCHLTLVHTLPSPVPPSPETSRALISAFAERGIEFLPGRRVDAIDAVKKSITLDDGRQLPCDLFLGVAKHRSPEVVIAAGLTDEKGWVTVNPQTLATPFPNVYAIGDLANTAGAPKAGVFAEGTARTVATNLMAGFRGQEQTAKYPGAGSCYIEFGADRIARVDVDFFSGPKPTGTFNEPSVALRADKKKFGDTRRARWFGR